AMKTYSNYINGQWTGAVSGKTFPIHNPAHRSEIIAHVQSSNAVDVEHAIDGASKAFENWSKTPAPKRGSYLKKASELLAKRRDEAATLLVKEEGKIIAEARGEIDRSIGLLDFYAHQYSLLSGTTIPSTMDNRFLYTLRVPLGPVALITPWNFPSAIPIWKSAPALLCGNTLILKPAEQAPLSALMFAEILHEAGLPPGVFNLITGDGENVGVPLTSDPRIKAISFTGSLEVGKSIARKCADRLIRVGLEMGGKNPHVVLEDADLDRATTDITVGAFWAAGHKCTAASRAIIVEQVHDALLDKLVKRTADLKVGDGLDPNTQIPPMLDERFFKQSLDAIATAQKEGAKLLVGGKRLTGGIYDDGFYLSPAILANVTPQMRIAKEEVFGPVLSIIKARDFDDAVKIANSVEFGLSAGLSTKNLQRSLEFARRLESGVIHINNPTAGLELQAPFGGLKLSTSGHREMGAAAIDFYSQLKTIYMDA
ncbi:MAG TPA: aldehyde dehydrogenase family protein, partial [Tepidisphaeraceae bacterium]|nr:aldehyde dehydrogenase family protein [Tepidisphaeraceae bacterium]